MMHRSVRKQFPQSPTPLDTPDLLQVMASAQAPLACTDAGGRLLWCNETFAALLAPAAAAGDDLHGRLGPHWAALWGQGWTPAVPGDDRRWRVVASTGTQGVVLTGQPLTDRDALEARLNELREQLDLVQHFTRTGIFERDPVTMSGTWDARMFDIWGLPAPASGERAPAPAISAMEPMIVEEDLRHHKFTESHTIAGDHSARLRVRRPDGSIRYIHTQWRVEHDAHGQPVRLRGVNTDDTRVYELATRAETLRGELDAALALARIGVWRHEIESNRVYLDERCSELMGVPLQREGITLQEAREHIHPDDRDLVIQATERTLRTGLPSDVELRYPQRDGSTRFVISRRALQHDADGRPLRFFGVMLDITEHHLVVQRLRETVERMTLTSRAIGIGAWETDERVSQVHWDEQMFRLRGVYSPGRTVSTDEIASYIHPDDRTKVIAAQADRLLAGATWQLEFRVQWPDGTVRWITSHSAPVADEQGRFVRRIGLNWDSTEAHRAAQALREREAALAQTQAKSRWMTRISHELRTPLNAILGFTQLAQRHSAAAGQTGVANWLALAEDAGQHLRDLIDDILELSGTATGELRLNLQPLKLADAVTEAVRLVQTDAHNQGVTVEPGHVVGSVLADPLRLRQVLLNLLSNAIKYNRQGGSVQLSSQEAADRVVLQVIDTGRGIPPRAVGGNLRALQSARCRRRCGARHRNRPGTGQGFGGAHGRRGQCDQRAGPRHGVHRVLEAGGGRACDRTRLHTGHGSARRSGAVTADATGRCALHRRQPGERAARVRTARRPPGRAAHRGRDWRSRPGCGNCGTAGPDLDRPAVAGHARSGRSAGLARRSAHCQRALRGAVSQCDAG